MMNERLKKLRKTLDLTQQEFANRLNVGRNNIAGYETGKRSPSDAVISLICREFNVSEEWLRNGVGEMFIEVSRDEQIATFVGDLLKDEADSFKRRFISMLTSLDTSDWETLEKIVELMQKEKD